MTREQRQLAYVGVLIELTGIDGEDIAERPPDQQFLIILKAIEERGVTLQDVEGWIELCDPQGMASNVGADPVGCFREKAAAAMEEPPSLARTVLLWGGASALAAFAATRLMKRR